MKQNTNFDNVGFQLMVNGSYAQLAQYIEDHALSVVQFFLFCPKIKTYLPLDQHDIEAFRRLRSKVRTIVVHTSYWINLASGKYETQVNSALLLEKELKMAEQLQADYVVLHPGSAKTQPHSGLYKKKAHAIAQCADVLNRLAPRFPQITILLENTALGKTMIGSQFDDLRALYTLVRDHANIGFCLDIAHAHIYGYDVKAVDHFLAFVDTVLGLDKVKLIHLNDTREMKGSGRDIHEVPGCGVIGAATLRSYATDPRLQHLPFVIEFPANKSIDMQSFREGMREW